MPYGYVRAVRILLGCILVYKYGFLGGKQRSRESVNLYYFYRPQRSWAKVIFLQACEGGLPQCMLGCNPPREQASPLGPDPPGADTPPDQTPHRIRPPGPDPTGADTPPRDGDSSIRSTSGRYASHWNAFLL